MKSANERQTPASEWVLKYRTLDEPSMCYLHKTDGLDNIMTEKVTQAKAIKAGLLSQFDVDFHRLNERYLRNTL